MQGSGINLTLLCAFRDQNEHLGFIWGPIVDFHLSFNFSLPMTFFPNKMGTLNRTDKY